MNPKEARQKANRRAIFCLSLSLSLALRNSSASPHVGTILACERDSSADEFQPSILYSSCSSEVDVCGHYTSFSVGILSLSQSAA